MALNEEEQVIQKQIGEKLGIWFAEVKKKKNEITLVTEASITFSLLDKISELFKTEDIDLGPEKRSDGYCETCHHEYAVNVLTIRNYDLSNFRE